MSISCRHRDDSQFVSFLKLSFRLSSRANKAFHSNSASMVLKKSGWLVEAVRQLALPHSKRFAWFALLSYAKRLECGDVVAALKRRSEAATRGSLRCRVGKRQLALPQSKRYFRGFATCALGSFEVLSMIEP